MQLVTILGSTGSIGTSTLDVIARNNKYAVHCLVANKNVELLYQQVTEFKPRYAVMADVDSAAVLREKLSGHQYETEVLAGNEAIVDVARDTSSSILMAAIVGAAGLLPTLAAIQAGKTVLLANKEALVMSGAYFMQQAKKANATLLPVDSEHNAIFQCLPRADVEGTYQGVEKIILTASGGPFRQKQLAELHAVTPAQACAHPNWDMGKKISVDSATMMNKGLELIEAYWLFGLPHESIDVVIHPESIIHSMVAYSDGSVLAQLGNPDMRTPIAHALAWPNRISGGVKPLDLTEVASLHFEKPDLQRFPCLRIAYDAIKQGGSATIVLNAANEIAVDAFLNTQIKFTDIPVVIEYAMEQMPDMPVSSIENIMLADKETRLLTKKYIKQSYA